MADDGRISVDKRTENQPHEFVLEPAQRGEGVVHLGLHLLVLHGGWYTLVYDSYHETAYPAEPWLQWSSAALAVALLALALLRLAALLGAGRLLPIPPHGATPPHTM